MSGIRFGEKTRVQNNELNSSLNYIPKLSNELKDTPFTVDTYTRPSDWPSLPTISTNRFHGLLAVENFPLQCISLRFAVSGGYTVDWGDGVVENFNSNVIANHEYSYSTLSSNVTSRGYKTAIIQVYPQTANNITTISLNERHPSFIGGANGVATFSYCTGWLDIAFDAPSANFFLSGNVASRMLEIVNISNSSISNARDLFNGCASLRSVQLKSNVLADCYGMFQECYQLQTLENLTTNSVTNMSQMFYSCYSLKNAPEMNTASVTDMSSMFGFTRALYTVPLYNTARVTRMDGMFNAASGLTVCPTFNTVNVTTMYNMFSSSALVQAPPFNTAKVTNMELMFSRCPKLISVPSYDTSNVSNAANMFQECSKLLSVPAFNMPKLSNAVNMFLNANNIIEIDITTTGNLTNTSGMFANCGSLRRVSNFETSNVTNMSNMFSRTTVLRSVPLFNTAKVTTMNSMFFASTKITTVPNFDTSNVTDMTSMFESATRFSDVPLFNTAKVTTMSRMFQSATSLVEVPLLNTVNVVNMSSMFWNTSVRTLPTFDTSNVSNMNQFLAFAYWIQSVPLFNTAKVTNFNYFIGFGGSFVLDALPEYKLHNVSSSVDLTPAVNVRTIKFTGLRFSLNISSYRLTGNELNNIYSNLAGLGNISVSSAVGDGANVVYTTSANHVYITGQNITVTGLTPAGYNVTNALIIASNATTFTVAGATTGTSSGTGTANGGANGAVITVTGCLGVLNDNTAIATSKNWTVTG